MRSMLVLICALIACGVAVRDAAAGDIIRYLECRADNESQESLVAIDETTKRVCDPEFGSAWMAPSQFDGSTIEWSDGSSRKSIIRSRKGSRYEHATYFIVVHIGHCNKVKAPSAPPCKS